MSDERDIVTCRICGERWERHKRKGFICHKCQARRRREKLKCPICGKSLGNQKSKTCRACYTPVEQNMEKNGNWNGGLTKHLRGYVLRKQPNHPRAHNGYVLEHILVMEEKIGRQLIQKETVHHKNGDKSDNRPENLELWASSHHSGQRVEDLIEYAVEILAKYAPEKLK